MTNSDKARKKGFIGRLIEKLDKKMEEKAKAQPCCESKDQEKNKPCCSE